MIIDVPLGKFGHQKPSFDSLDDVEPPFGKPQMVKLNEYFPQESKSLVQAFLVRRLHNVDFLVIELNLSLESHLTHFLQLKKEVLILSQVVVQVQIIYQVNMPMTVFWGCLRIKRI